jgi:hypothetical protein
VAFCNQVRKCKANSESLKAERSSICRGLTYFIFSVAYKFLSYSWVLLIHFIIAHVCNNARGWIHACMANPLATKASMQLRWKEIVWAIRIRSREKTTCWCWFCGNDKNLALYARVCAECASARMIIEASGAAAATFSHTGLVYTSCFLCLAMTRNRCAVACSSRLESWGFV